MNSSLILFAGLAVAIVTMAGLFRVLVPDAPRRRLRRCVILLALYAGTLVAKELVGWGGATAVSTGFGIAGRFIVVGLVINLAALLVFDILIHLTRWDYPDILHDLTVGACYLAAIAWLMSQVGVNVTSIVATSAVVTAVIGLSLQATLGNIVGGVALQMDDSVQEGDWVELENKTQGLVKKIRWRHTVIETRDWDTLIVPNGQLMSQSIRVLGKREGQPLQHRMWVYFNVDHRYSPGEVIRVINEALQGAPIEGAALEPKPHCICLDLARENRDSYCYYAVRYHLTDLARDDPTSSLVRERIYAALKRAQLPLAIPAKAVFVSHDDPEHAARKHTRAVEQKLSALQGVDLFLRLSDEEKWSLAESARLTPFGPREVITRQGATAHWLYVLTKGRAEVRVATDGGDERAVAVLTAPSFFGEMALMTGQPREATVVALTDSECLRVDKGDFQGILQRRPEVAQDISGVLAQRRVELLAVRENLDAEARNSRLSTEKTRILSSIRSFFALDDGR